MIQVYIELTNIQWENDEEGDIECEQGTYIDTIVDIPDSDHLTREEIDESIADSIENQTGCRPESWTLEVFDDTLEEA